MTEPLATGRLDPSCGGPFAGPLAGAAEGALVRVGRVAADAATRRHLAALGMRAGAIVELVRDLGADGVVIGLCGDRLALPRDLARSIRCEAVERGGAASLTGAAP